MHELSVLKEEAKSKSSGQGNVPVGSLGSAALRTNAAER
jgi:hypothetical protein